MTDDLSVYPASPLPADDPFDGLLLNESALAQDWNTPEADAAWASL